MRHVLCLVFSQKRDNPHAASKTETLHVFPLPLNLIDRIGFINLVRLENAIQLTASLKSQQHQARTREAPPPYDPVTSPP